MKKRLFSLILIIMLFAWGCGNNSAAEQTQTPASAEEAESSYDTNDTGNSGSTDSIEDLLKADDMFTGRDYEIGFDESSAVSLILKDDSITSSSDSVEISGATATITQEGTYLLSGSLTDGQIVVNAGQDAKLQLVLNGVTINSETSAGIFVQQADKVFLTTAAGTDNQISNGGTFSTDGETNIDAAVFSKDDLTLNGEGTLTVLSPAGHGIVSKDDLVITSGTYSIESAFHGLDANDSVRAADAMITINAGKDGIHANNNEDNDPGFVYIAGGTYTIDALDDGISAGACIQAENGSFSITSGCDAVHSDDSVTVNGGSFQIECEDDGFHGDLALTVTGGTIRILRCYEGLEALQLNLSGGDITVNADDDGLNAAGGTDSSGFNGPGGNDGFGAMKRNGGGNRGMNDSSGQGSIVISGGTLSITASGDGIDSNGSLLISGGDVTVTGPVQGDTATLDYDTTGEITGGTFVGTGASGMAQTFSSSQQGVVAVSAGNQSAGTRFTLSDKEGNVILSGAPDLPYNVVILSSPLIEKGTSYTLTVGSLSQDFTAD